jgi:hypothetical protein
MGRLTRRFRWASLTWRPHRNIMFRLVERSWRKDVHTSKAYTIKGNIEQGCELFFAVSSGIVSQSELAREPREKPFGSETDKEMGLLGFWTLLIARYSKQHNVSETGSISILVRGPTTSLDSKVLLYKTIIKPIWTYGVESWGCASKSHIDIMQRSQSKRLRMITNAPRYVSN